MPNVTSAMTPIRQSPIARPQALSEERAREAAADYMRDAGWCVDYDFVRSIHTPLSRAMIRFEREITPAP